MAETSIKVRPFRLPNYVIEDASPDRQPPPGKWAVEDLDADALSDLCDEFRRGIFKKAGKTDPKATE